MCSMALCANYLVSQLKQSTLNFNDPKHFSNEFLFCFSTLIIFPLNYKNGLTQCFFVVRKTEKVLDLVFNPGLLVSNSLVGLKSVSLNDYWRLFFSSISCSILYFKSLQVLCRFLYYSGSISDDFLFGFVSDYRSLESQFRNDYIYFCAFLFYCFRILISELVFVESLAAGFFESDPCFLFDSDFPGLDDSFVFIFSNCAYKFIIQLFPY